MHFTKFKELPPLENQQYTSLQLSRASRILPLTCLWCINHDASGGHSLEDRQFMIIDIAVVIIYIVKFNKETIHWTSTIEEFDLLRSVWDADVLIC